MMLVSNLLFTVSSIAPNSALVAGLYLRTNFINISWSLISNSLIIAFNRIQEFSTVVSGIFLIFLILSKILSNGIFSLVILLGCLINLILYIPLLVAFFS